MDYASAIAYLTGRERYGIKFGLENIGLLAESLGHPELAYRSVLVAGTNGKGSTAAILESILRASGYATGRYTSPHLVRLEERMMAGGSLISAEELASIVEVLAERIARLRSEGKLLTEPTFFEVTTACCFEFFRRKEVELAVLEVGMGGRWDATNIAPADLTVITNIAFDHERFLGRTLYAIAAEKAATIKPGKPVVTGVDQREPLEVIRAEAERQGSSLFEVPAEVRWEAEEIEKGQRVRLETPEATYGDLFLPLAGAHQLQNLALAVRAAEVARGTCLLIPREALLSGVASTVWEARLEKVAGRPELLIDSAHNPHGAEALGLHLQTHPHPDRVLLFGAMKDKNIAGMIDLLFPCAKRAVVTRPPNRRAEEPGLIVRRAVERGFQAEAAEPPARALELARARAGEGGEVVVAGSIFLAGEIKRILEESRAGT